MKRIIAILILSAAISGCYRDKGNYEYHDINDVFIGGVEQSYTSLFKDTLRINPALTFSTANPESDLEYEWLSIYLDASNDSSRKVIGTARNLIYELAGATGRYNILFRVRNKKTGVQYNKRMSLTVQSSVYEGWLLMNDVNGFTRIDMISKLPGEDRVIHDLSGYSTAPMPPLKGPRALTMAADYVSQVTASTNLYVLTDDGTMKMNGNTWKWDVKHNILREMLGPTPSTFRPRLYTSFSGANIMLTDDKEIYANVPVFGVGFGTPVNKLMRTNEPVDISPFVGIPNSTTPFTCLLFDKTRRWFIKLNTNSDLGCDTIPTPDNALFRYKIGMDMIWMGYTQFNGGDNVAIMQDPASGKRYIIRITLNGGTPIFLQNQFTEINESTGDIAHAERFAFGQTNGYLLYAVGGKLYQYDINYNTHKLMLDLGAEKISVIRTRNFTSTAEPYYSYTRSLQVGSYLPGGKEGENGKFRIYVMPERNEPFTLFREWDGFGKIVDISYRHR